MAARSLKLAYGTARLLRILDGSVRSALRKMGRTPLKGRYEAGCARDDCCFVPHFRCGPFQVRGGGSFQQSTPPLMITTASLPNGTSETPYSQEIQASGGVAPFTWSVSTGTLPHN